MSKLITLNGNTSALNNFNKKGDLVAGLAFWKIVAEENPGITWREVVNMQNDGLNGILDYVNPFKVAKKIKSYIGDSAGSIAKGFKNVINYVGDKGGAAVRLFADEKVSDSINSYIKSYKGDTPSQGLTMDDLKALFAGSGDKFKKGANDDVDLAGMPSIGMLGTINGKWVIGGIAALLGVVLLTNRK